MSLRNTDTVAPGGDSRHPLRPVFASIEDWLTLSGMGRRATYDSLGSGELKAIKRGTRTLIDVEAGLAWLRSLPAAKIRAPRQRQSGAA